MERFNPFSSNNLQQTTGTSTTTTASTESPAAFITNNPKLQETTTSTSTTTTIAASSCRETSRNEPSAAAVSSSYSRTYSTSFPDPFGGEPLDMETTVRSKVKSETRLPSPPPPMLADSSTASTATSGRSNSMATSVDEQQHQSTSATTSRLSRQASGLSSFLSRASSVASSSVDRMGSGVRGAVDTISSQIQSAVPGVGNSSDLTILSTGQSSTTNTTNPPTCGTNTIPMVQKQQQQSAASYLASKLSSATGQFTSSVSNQSSGSMLTISRQRVILVLDSQASTDWTQQFTSYRRLTSGGSSSSATGIASAPTAALSYLLSSASHLTGGGGGGQSALIDGSDLIEQADFRDVSVLANQLSSTATIYVNNSSNISGSTQPSGGRVLGGRGQQQQQQPIAKLIKPEFVVVRQKTKDNLDHLKAIVTALNYCLVPMFEPIEVWNIFQDRQLIFAKLLSVQKQLGRENFPLVPQIYLQTHQDLYNYLQSSTVSLFLPCLVRIGPLGRGKIKIENLQMLQDFASIMEVSKQSCTIEQYIDVKCDLIIQKLGTSLKVYKRATFRPNQQQDQSTGEGAITLGSAAAAASSRQTASRQASLGSSMLSTLISTASGQLSSSSSSQQQQHNFHQVLSRRNSSSFYGPYERLNLDFHSSRYKRWVDAIAQEFDQKLETFCIKIAVSSNDREYIVGLSNCSMDFIGNPENQEEDRRSYVEMIISKMNTVLPKTQSSKEVAAIGSSITATGDQNSILTGGGGGGGGIRRFSRETDTKFKSTSSLSFKATNEYITPDDKRKFVSQAQIGCTDGSRRVESQPIGDGGGGGSISGVAGANGTNRNYGQLGNRSKSVIVNNYEYDRHQPSGVSSFQSTGKLSRRSSDRTDSSKANAEMDDLSCMTTLTGADSISSSSNSQNRQTSLGQSFLDQTSTAWTSFHKQSFGFFKRLEARSQEIPGTTPPMSAKSDKAFDRAFLTDSEAGSLGRSGASIDAVASNERQVGFSGLPSAAAATTTTGGMTRNGFKSQSVDGSSGDGQLSPRKRPAPPKPPPPPALTNRQSSLANYSTSSPTRRVVSSTATPTSTPVHTRQNSANVEASSNNSIASSPRGELADSGSGHTRVIRQNSALSAFEPFDPELQTQLKDSATNRASETTVARGNPLPPRSSETTVMDRENKLRGSMESSTNSNKKSTNFDSASVTSGDSNSTEDTGMGNLEKTFASIFGEKC